MVDECNWRDYLDASTRKVEIARYHHERLSALLSDNPGLTDVAIPIQAEFEGILAAVIAASDQLAEAINQACELGIEHANLQQVIDHQGAVSRRRLRRWQQAPIAADLRDIRRLAIHHHYKKSTDGPRIEVQLPKNARPYGGDRDLLGYANAVIEHARWLRALLDDVESELDSSSARSGQPSL